jgi:CHAD domain-containing protein
MAWRFEGGEDLSEAFRRVAEEEIARVRAGFDAGEGNRARAIHAARQGFKRLRALARLARPTLGSRYAAENRRWRDAGRLLSGSRDRTVLEECFDTLVADDGIDLPTRTIETLKKCVLADSPAPSSAETEASVEQVLEVLDAVADIGLAWPRSSSDLRHGLRKSQAQLRKAWKAACRDGSPDALHNWRKRVKDQSAQLRLFRSIVPEALLELRSAAKETAEHLGEEHDLWLLSERLSDMSVPKTVAKARAKLLSVIKERRTDLRRKAFERGEGFSSRSAKAFAREVSDAWDEASKRAGKKSRRRRPGGSRAAPPAASTSQAG